MRTFRVVYRDRCGATMKEELPLIDLLLCKETEPKQIVRSLLINKVKTSFVLRDGTRMTVYPNA